MNNYRPNTILLAGTMLSLGSEALAHAEQPHSPAATLTQWNFDPIVVIPLLLATLWYALGLCRLWLRVGVGRGISIKQAGSWFAGVAVLVIALLSPLDAISTALFSVHMVQHLLLILVAPPLLVVGAADLAFLWALPVTGRKRFGRFEHGIGRALSGESGAAAPLCAVLLATGVLWLWHLPALYDLAVRVESIHIAEHAGFLISSLLFWITVLRLRPRDHVRNGLRMLYLFGMAVQGTMLGALITFAAQPLYQSHVDSAPAWGLTPLVDQQLAGLLMWVPPALLYLGVLAYLFIHWLNALDARRRTLDSKQRKAFQLVTNARESH